VSAVGRGRLKVVLVRRQNFVPSPCCILPLPNCVACSHVPRHVQTCTPDTKAKHGSRLVGSLPLESGGGMWLLRLLSCMIFPQAAPAENLLSRSQYCSGIRVIATEDGVGNAVSTDASLPHCLVAQVLATWAVVL